VAERELVKCRECHRLIFWAETILGAAMPIDPIPKPWQPPYPKPPNVVIDEASGKARVLGRAELAIPAAPGEPRYLVHWASCPHARRVKEFMDRRRAKADAKRQRLEAEEAELDELRHT
jgi:hypothetical protein